MPETPPWHHLAAPGEQRRPGGPAPDRSTTPDPRAGSGPSTGPDPRADLTTPRAAPPATPRAAPPATPRAAPPATSPGGSLVRRMLRGRRRTLIAAGTGTVAVAGLGTAAAAMLLGDSIPEEASNRPGSPRDAGAFADRDASYVKGETLDLGASGIAETPGQAAAAALKATPKFTNPLDRDPALHLLRRATFGPTSPDLAEVRREGVDAWIERQLDPTQVPDDALDRALVEFPLLAMSTGELRVSLDNDDRDEPQRQLGHATIARQLWSHRQLFEVMVDFWSNHLNMTNPFDGGWDTRTVADRDVIRAHALGRFSDMLLASAKSPAMLRYLDNASSDRKSVNENYGRELLELHTVGISGGYNETDVRHSAYILTGRTVGDNGLFKYDAKKHYTGKVKVLDFTHDNKVAGEGLAVGDAYLTYLAKHPATAKNIARKLAVRFVCDSPPVTLVDRLAKAYLDNGTAIVPVLRVLFRSLEFWISTGLKTRRPLENFIAAARAVGIEPDAGTRKAAEEMYKQTERLGQAPLAWGPPNGYPDVAGAWSSAHAMLGTWNAHRAMVQGRYVGVRTPKAQYLASPAPATVGEYLDALARRLVFQQMQPRERQALLKFLGAQETTPIKDATLGNRVQHVAALVLDSVYHAMR